MSITVQTISSVGVPKNFSVTQLTKLRQVLFAAIAAICALGAQSAAASSGADVVMKGGGPGLTSLIRTTPEPAGANCPTGGTRLQLGLDTNRDGELQASEVTFTHYVCSAAATTRPGKRPS